MMGFSDDEATQQRLIARLLTRREQAAANVLQQYRMYRRRGHSPLLAMEMVKSSVIAITFNAQFPDKVTASSAMEAFCCNQYIRKIYSRIQGAGSQAMMHHWIFGDPLLDNRR